MTNYRVYVKGGNYGYTTKRKTYTTYTVIATVDGVEKKYSLEYFMSYKEILKLIYKRENCQKAWIIKVEKEYFEE